MDADFFKALGVVLGLGVAFALLGPPIFIFLIKYVNWLYAKAGLDS